MDKEEIQESQLERSPQLAAEQTMTMNQAMPVLPPISQDEASLSDTNTHIASSKNIIQVLKSPPPEEWNGWDGTI